MTKIDYARKIRVRALNTYFVAEGDGDYNIRKQTIIDANPCCNCYSIAKAFTVTAVGMLYDRGLLTPDMKMADVLCDLMPQDIDEKWYRVTLRDIMLHHIGFDCGKLDIDAEDASRYPSTDYLNMVLTSPLAHEPGTVHRYTDAAYYLMSRIVAKASGIGLSDLLRPALTDTMRFKEYTWSVCPQGHAMGATGLYLRTEDLVKLGMLYINGGRWHDTQIISEEWVNIVLKEGFEFKPLANGWYGKGGMRGQMLVFNVDKKLAVACHSYENSFPHEILLS